MVGKSTVAALLGAKLSYPCISTDDVGEILQTALNINPMKGTFYLDYYANTAKDQLIEDIVVYHHQLETAICRLIEIHSSWGSPLIMEGWALYPEAVKKLENDHVFSIWLVAENGLLKKRMLQRSSFYQGADNPEKVIENYVYRSESHNKTIIEQCKMQHQKYLMVNECTATDDIVNGILEMIGYM